MSSDPRPIPFHRLEGTPDATGRPPLSSSSSGRLGWLLRPIRLERCRGVWQFIIRILVQQFAAKVAVAILIGLLIPDAGLADRTEQLRNPVLAFFALVIVAPPIESLLLQAAPIETLRVLRRSRRLQWFSGLLPFAALHFVGGVASGIAAGVIGGAFFSHTYLECRGRSLWTAIWATTAAHSLHNLVVLPLALAFAK